MRWSITCPRHGSALDHGLYSVRFLPARPASPFRDGQGFAGGAATRSLKGTLPCGIRTPRSGRHPYWRPWASSSAFVGRLSGRTTSGIRRIMTSYRAISSRASLNPRLACRLKRFAPALFSTAQNQGFTLGSRPSGAKARDPRPWRLQLAPSPDTGSERCNWLRKHLEFETLQLAPTQQVQFQTLQMAPAQVQFQTLQLAPALVQVQTVQLAPVQTQTLQLVSQAVATQSVTPVTLLLPRHKCNWFCKYRH